LWLYFGDYIPGASIVNVTSTVAHTEDQLAGDVAVGGIRVLTTKVAQHCSKNRYPVRCNAVHMTYVPPEMIPENVDDEIRAKYLKDGKYINEEEAAKCVLYLLSRESDDNGGEINLKAEPVIVNKLLDPQIYGLKP
jgi:NAD(P)-dependent dehydrogenase (short-subunit alcohol dehydrogenase family)